MKKLLAVASLTLAALGFGVAPASAGLFCHCHGAKFGACGYQYNAFSPVCVTGVYTTHHCHKCYVPAQTPCDNAGCADGVCGPAAVAGGDAATLGTLPTQSAPGTALNGQGVAPAPGQAMPGARSGLFSRPVGTIQPLGPQPAMPAPLSPVPGANGN